MNSKPIWTTSLGRLIFFAAIVYSFVGLTGAQAVTLQAPSSLKVTSAAPGGLVLTWKDRSRGEQGFKVERSRERKSGFRAIHQTRSNVTSYRDRHLLSVGTYYYRIRAFRTRPKRIYSTYSNTAWGTVSLPGAGSANTSERTFPIKDIPVPWHTPGDDSPSGEEAGEPTGTDTTDETESDLPSACAGYSYSRRVDVADTDSLQDALEEAEAGDLILMKDGVYSDPDTTVPFKISDISGESDSPIVLCGSRGAILDGSGDGTPLDADYEFTSSSSTSKGTSSLLPSGKVIYMNNASHWVLAGFTIRNSNKGILADNVDSSTFNDLELNHFGDEALHLRNGSSYNTIENSLFYDTGYYKVEYGEGVYIGTALSNMEPEGTDDCYTTCSWDKSDYNTVSGNTFGEGITAENVDLKEGTTGNTVSGNTFNGTGSRNAGNSWIDVKGNDAVISHNSGVNDSTTDPSSTFTNGFELHIISNGWSSNNSFSANTMALGTSGYGIYIQKSKTLSSGSTYTPTSNVVACSNVIVSPATAVLSNVTCS